MEGILMTIIIIGGIYLYEKYLNEKRKNSGLDPSIMPVGDPPCHPREYQDIDENDEDLPEEPSDFADEIKHIRELYTNKEYIDIEVCFTSGHNLMDTGNFDGFIKEQQIEYITIVACSFYKQGKKDVFEGLIKRLFLYLIIQNVERFDIEEYYNSSMTMEELKQENKRYKERVSLFLEEERDTKEFKEKLLNYYNIINSHLAEYGMDKKITKAGIIKYIKNF